MVLLTPAEYAKRIGKDRATVYRWIHQKKLTPVKETRTVYRIPYEVTDPGEGNKE